MVREGIRVVTMLVRTVDLVDQTADRLAQGVLEAQQRSGLGTTDCLCRLEPSREPPVVDTLLEPRRLREEARQMGFVSTRTHPAGDVRYAFVGEHTQACQVMLKRAKLAPILTEIAKDIRVGGHDGSRRYDGQLHETFALSPRGWERA
jgi:hypothetical protein